MHRRDVVNGKTSVRRKKDPPKPEALPVEGWPRPYLRDGVAGLPIERQREMLAELGLGLAADRAYIDEMGRARIAKKGALPRRDEAVNPRHPGEVVYVAGLRVLGWDHLDVLRAMSAAFDAGARIYCADTRSVYSGEMPAHEIARALARAEEARRSARTKRATEGSLSRRAKRVQDGLAVAREMWTGPASARNIAAIVGLSTRTLYARLGPRSEAKEVKAKGKKHA